MMRKMNKGDANLEPDSSESDRFFSDEWLSENGALICITFDTASWHAILINDLKIRGPAMLDLISLRLSLDPQVISLFLCDDEQMRSINFMYRGHNKATNVLSFSNNDDLQWAANIPAKELPIGDIAIAGETVVREASEVGVAAGDHLLHLFTHGVLHLLGFDHEEDGTAAKMESLEIDLLAQMKIANPYYSDYPDQGIREIG